MAGWEEYALLRAPTQASLDTLPSEAPVRVGGPAGSADQNGSRGPNNLALGAGIVYGTAQALLPMGFATPSPAPHPLEHLCECTVERPRRGTRAPGKA